MSGRLLVAYSNAANYVATTSEYLASISRYSEWDVHYVHVTHGAEIAVNVNDYDAIFQSYCARWPEGLISRDFADKLKIFRGIKVLSVQDEYERTDILRQAIREVGYHAVLTGMPAGTRERIFPPERFPGTEFVTVLTGYVPELSPSSRDMVRPLCERPVIIGYRGRDIGARYGRRAFEKLEIGRRMREICIGRGIAHDIEWTEDKRLYGEAWYEFNASCRVTLGSETGSNVFDFEGSIEAQYKRLSASRGSPVPYEEFRTYTDPIERQYETGLISPRLLEAAAMRTPMVLFTGHYSGLVAPGEHYVELKKDFSNIDAVLAALDDLGALERMADRAFDRLVGSGDFSYRQLVKLIDTIIDRKAAELGANLRPAAGPKPAVAIGDDLNQLASLRERATTAPRHPVFFRYKSAVQENQRQAAEITRLTQFYTGEITSLSHEYTTETNRLKRDYGLEIAGLQKEIARIHHTYQSEVRDRNSELTRINTELTRTHEYYTAEIEWYRSRLLWLIRIYRFVKPGIVWFQTFVQTLRKLKGSPR